MSTLLFKKLFGRMSSIELEEAPGHYFIKHFKSACGKLEEIFHGKIHRS